MTIASVGSLGTGTRNGAGTSTTITTSAVAEVGNLIVVMVAMDNVQTTDQQSNDVTSVTDSVGNTYTKIGEYTNGQGAAAAGATVAAFQSVVTIQLGNGGVITVNHSSVNDVALRAWEFTLDTDAIGVYGTLQVLANDAADPGSMTLGSLVSDEYLFLRLTSTEGETTTGYTVTTNYTSIDPLASSTAGAAAGNIVLSGEFRIVTATTSTSDPTFTAEDSASIMFALREVFSLAIGAGSYSLTGAAVSLLYGPEIVAGSGSYSLVGADVALKRGYLLSIESGSYGVTGSEVSLEHGRDLNVDGGVYSLTGSDVTLTYTPTGGVKAHAWRGRR